MKPAQLMSVDEAVLALRADPSQAALLRDAYLDGDVAAGAERFLASGEFAAVREALGPLEGLTVLDVGAGNGMASWAFARAGAGRVVALEPDPSELVGRGAMAPLLAQGAFEVADGLGERLPFDDASFDVVYARQVLHHIAALPQALAEFARVLKPGGRLLACREHVCDSPAELEAFLAAHPIHRLAGNEGAHSHAGYLGAIGQAGLALRADWGPLDSLINARADAGPGDLGRLHLRPLRRLGPLAPAIAALPGVDALMRRLSRWHAARVPGRLHTFLAIKEPV